MSRSKQTSRSKLRRKAVTAVGVAGALIGYQIAVLLALGGGVVTSAIAAALGAVVVLFAWRMAK